MVVARMSTKESTSRMVLRMTLSTRLRPSRGWRAPAGEDYGHQGDGGVEDSKSKQGVSSGRGSASAWR